MGENEETYIDGLDANDIQADTATLPMWAIAAFRGMILISFHCKWSGVSWTVHCSSLILRSPCCFELSRASFSFPRGMFSEVDVEFASRLHTLCSRHVDPPEHLADSSPMHGGNVVLVAAMNSPTTFCYVDYV